MDSAGSFLLRDYAGKAVWLIIKNEKDMLKYPPLAWFSYPVNSCSIMQLIDDNKDIWDI